MPFYQINSIKSMHKFHVWHKFNKFYFSNCNISAVFYFRACCECCASFIFVLRFSPLFFPCFLFINLTISLFVLYFLIVVRCYTINGFRFQQLSCEAFVSTCFWSYAWSYFQWWLFKWHIHTINNERCRFSPTKNTQQKYEHKRRGKAKNPMHKM